MISLFAIGCNREQTEFFNLQAWREIFMLFAVLANRVLAE
jgi:hypothetical protein